MPNSRAGKKANSTQGLCDTRGGAGTLLGVLRDGAGLLSQGAGWTAQKIQEIKIVRLRRIPKKNVVAPQKIKIVAKKDFKMRFRNSYFSRRPAAGTILVKNATTLPRCTIQLYIDEQLQERDCAECAVIRSETESH